MVNVSQTKIVSTNNDRSTTPQSLCYCYCLFTYRNHHLGTRNVHNSILEHCDSRLDISQEDIYVQQKLSPKCRLRGTAALESTTENTLPVYRQQVKNDTVAAGDMICSSSLLCLSSWLSIINDAVDGMQDIVHPARKKSPSQSGRRTTFLGVLLSCPGIISKIARCYRQK